MSLIAGLALVGCAVNTALRSETHTVEQGQTLHSIAWQYDLNWRQLARWNDLEAPYTIYPGQQLRLTRQASGERRRADEPASTGTVVSTDNDSSTTTSNKPKQQATAGREATADDAGTGDTGASKSRVSEDKGGASATAALWQWPVDGDVVRQHDASDSRDGLDIAGELGGAVRAARAGRVVYSGSGLNGYGKLLIVKHDDNYLSAYGFNRRLLTKEGAQVSAGQKIGEMGAGPGQSPMLHFEIRRGGQPLDAAQLLPSRGG